MSLHLQIFDVKPHLAVGAMVLISRRELYRPIFTNTTAYYLGRSFSWSPTIKEVHIKAYFCEAQNKFRADLKHVHGPKRIDELEPTQPKKYSLVSCEHERKLETPASG